MPSPITEEGPQKAEMLDAAHLEEKRVKGAIKTDFILSAEIMTIASADIESGTIWTRAAVLAIVGHLSIQLGKASRGH
jgi:uncharacterized protein